MKNFLFLFAFLFCIGAFAAVPKDFSWNNRDLASLNSQREQCVKDGDKYFTQVIDALIMLAPDSTDNISYDEFKKLFFKGDGSFNKHVFFQCIYCVKRFNKFAKDVWNEADFNKDPYVLCYFPAHIPNLSVAELRQATVLGFKNCHDNQCRILLNRYKSIMDQFTDDEVKSDLKKIKRYIYPNIGKSERWKALVVELELMIKSYE